MASRRFDWISSSCGDPARLATLQETMDRFYRRPEVREAYQRYIDKREAETFDHPFERQVAEYLNHLRPALALEVGCGNGRFFRTLRRAGFRGKYLGTEVADWIVRDCIRRHPDASWIAASSADTERTGTVPHPIDPAPVIDTSVQEYALRLVGPYQR